MGTSICPAWIENSGIRLSDRYASSSRNVLFLVAAPFAAVTVRPRFAASVRRRKETFLKTVPPKKMRPRRTYILYAYDPGSPLACLTASCRNSVQAWTCMPARIEKFGPRRSSLVGDIDGKVSAGFGGSIIGGGVSVGAGWSAGGGWPAGGGVASVGGAPEGGACVGGFCANAVAEVQTNSETARNVDHDLRVPE